MYHFIGRTSLRLLNAIPDDFCKKELRIYVIDSAKAVIEDRRCATQIRRALKHERVYIALDAKMTDDVERRVDSWDVFSIAGLVDQLLAHDRAIVQWIDSVEQHLPSNNGFWLPWVRSQI